MEFASRVGLLVSLPLIVSSCFAAGEGVEPPLDRFYFPVGLAVSPGGSRLYVANSDFDLQYNGGSLQALNLARIREFIPRSCQADADCSDDSQCDLEPTSQNGGVPSHWCVARAGRNQGRPCGALPEKTAARRYLFPGRCEYVDQSHPPDGGRSLVVDRVGLGAFATELLYRQNPGADGGMLYVPVRGDASLHFVEVEDDSERGSVGYELECGQGSNQGDCSEKYRAGKDPDRNIRDLRLPQEPFGVGSTTDGTATLVTHQTEGAVSLFVNRWDGKGPMLEYVAGGMPSRAIAVAPIPEPAMITRARADGERSLNYQPGFYVTFANSAELRLLRYFSEGGASDDLRSDTIAPPFLQQSGTVTIKANSAGWDSRGIAVDASARQACEAGCDGDLPCLGECAGIELQVFVANRAPDSLLVGKTRTSRVPNSTDDLPAFYDSVPVASGASRVTVGHIIDTDGQLAPRVFVVSFDERVVAIYDPVARRVEKLVETGRGPHALAIDVDPEARTSGHPPAYAYAYVAHFTDSYLGVVDLDQRHSRTFGQIVLSIGKPTAPRAAK